MKKIALLTLLLALASVGIQAQSIIKSLERNIPGQGKVTIHQDPRIEALIGMERPATGEQKVIKPNPILSIRKRQRYHIAIIVDGNCNKPFVNI